MKELFEKYRELFVVAIFLLVVFIIVNFLIMPLWTQIGTKSNRIQEKIAERDYQLGKLREKPEMKGKYEKILAEEGQIRGLISKDDAVVVIESLEKMAADTGNEITISIQEDLAGKPVAKKAAKNGEQEKGIVELLPSDQFLKMSIELAGSYNSVYTFIKKLENFTYQNDLINFQLLVFDVDLKKQVPSSSPFVTSGTISNNQEPEQSKKEQKVKGIISAVFYNQ